MKASVIEAVLISQLKNINVGHSPPDSSLSTETSLLYCVQPRSSSATALAHKPLLPLVLTD